MLSVTKKGKGSIISDTTIGPGRALAALSTSGSVLARRLGLGPTGGEPGRQFVTVSGVAESQPISSPVDAAILRLLAGLPGLINSGAVVDRAGRPGVVVSLDSAYTGRLIRYALVLDSRTGKLLEAEQTLIGAPPRKVDVQTGAVLSYTAFLASGYTANITTRP